MDNIVMMLNNNRVLWGVSMLLLNFGSRYVIGDLGKSHEIILSSEIFKKIIIFSMFFVATRDVLTSFLLTIAYILIIDGILHEKRKFCLLPKSIINQAKISQVAGMSKDDYERAKNMVLNYENAHKTNIDKDNDDVFKKQLYVNYLTNLSVVKGR